MTIALHGLMLYPRMAFEAINDPTGTHRKTPKKFVRNAPKYLKRILIPAKLIKNVKAYLPRAKGGRLKLRGAHDD